MVIFRCLCGSTLLVPFSPSWGCAPALYGNNRFPSKLPFSHSDPVLYPSCVCRGMRVCVYMRCRVQLRGSMDKAEASVERSHGRQPDQCGDGGTRGVSSAGEGREKNKFDDYRVINLVCILPSTPFNLFLKRRYFCIDHDDFEHRIYLSSAPLTTTPSGLYF